MELTNNTVHSFFSTARRPTPWGALEENTAEEAIQAINSGLETIQKFFEKHEAEEHYESDELVVRLIELRESLRTEYAVGQTLMEKLADAVAGEQYELAAELRDELTRRDAK